MGYQFTGMNFGHLGQEIEIIVIQSGISHFRVRVPFNSLGRIRKIRFLNLMIYCLIDPLSCNCAFPLFTISSPSVLFKLLFTFCCLVSVLMLAWHCFSLNSPVFFSIFNPIIKCYGYCQNLHLFLFFWQYFISIQQCSYSFIASTFNICNDNIIYVWFKCIFSFEIAGISA